MTISGFSEKKILLYNDQWTIKIQTWSSPLCRQVWCQVCMKSGVISAPPHTLREYSTSSYIARIQLLTLQGYSSSLALCLILQGYNPPPQGYRIYCTTHPRIQIQCITLCKDTSIQLYQPLSSIVQDNPPPHTQLYQPLSSIIQEASLIQEGSPPHTSFPHTSFPHTRIHFLIQHLPSSKDTNSLIFHPPIPR